MSKEVKQYFIYIRSTGEKVPVTKEQHDSFYREASASVTRNRITAGACALTASSGSVTAIASAASITRQVTPFSGSASPGRQRYHRTITSRTRVLLWKM
jgi:hypothetical protein